MFMFYEWINKMYVEWRGNATGQERSISEYAAYIGVSQPVMSGWLNKKHLPSHDGFMRLYEIYGAEALIALGKPPNVEDEILSIIRLKYPKEDLPQLLAIIQERLKSFDRYDLDRHTNVDDLDNR